MLSTKSSKVPRTLLSSCQPWFDWSISPCTCWDVGFYFSKARQKIVKPRLTHSPICPYSSRGWVDLRVPEKPGRKCRPGVTVAMTLLGCCEEVKLCYEEGEERGSVTLRVILPVLIKLISFPPLLKSTQWLPIAYRIKFKSFQL